MLGLPGETKETMQRTIDFALTLLNKYDVEVINFMATPLYGSELYNMCEKNNYFSKEINPKSLSESTQPDGYCLIDTKSVSHKDVERMSRQFTAKIYRIMLKKALKNPAHSVRRVGNLYMFNKILKRIISIK